MERAAQPGELREQVALAGYADLRHRERERRRGGARAGVVVAAARGYDALAVANGRRRAVGVRVMGQLFFVALLKEK
jgi:hypothetical protein